MAGAKPPDATRAARQPRRNSRERGSATVEQVGLLGLIALLFAVAILAVTTHGPIAGGRELSSLIGRRMSCAPLLPGPCHRDRLIPAYGESLARLTRALAPSPAELVLAVPNTARSQAGGSAAGLGLVTVDFRYCRRASCATPIPGPKGERLTQSNRRITAFTEVRDERRQGGALTLRYWLYRPGLAWTSIDRHAGPAELAAAASTPLGGDETPILVPLETLPGRNHIPFRRVEEPPWRWQVSPVYPGRPS